MKSNVFRGSVLIMLLMSRAVFSQHQNIVNLPMYNKDILREKVDWLIKPVVQKSVVYRTPENYLAFSNGLITRTFSIAPNVATIGLDNIVTGESLVRAASPEAIIWIKGKEIRVGGLIGQPIGNYLLPTWLKDMKADPKSMKLVSWETSPNKTRFDWKQRKEWISQNVDWQPKGTELTFTYKADEQMIAALKNQLLDDAQRKLVWKDDFLTLSSKWQIKSGSGKVKMSFLNEGKPGETLGAPDNVAYAEQPLPTDAKVIICKLTSGTDLSTTYGAGLTLAFADGKNIKFYLSAGDKKFAVNNRGELKTFDGLQSGSTYYLRAELKDNEVILGISTQGDKYTTLTRLPIVTKPIAIRVGKTDPMGGNQSGNLTLGTIGRSKIDGVTILGDVDNASYQFLSDLTVKVHYELYDGIPVIGKWVTIENASNNEVVIDNIATERLAITEAENAVEHKKYWQEPSIFAQSDFAFGSGTPAEAAGNGCVEWATDSTYTTQVNYELQSPVILQCKPKHGLGQEVSAAKPFESMRLWELVYGSTDRERRGLEKRKMFRTIAPWSQENPIIMHVSGSSNQAVKKVIDQCAEVGFEMVIMTFGSGFDVEDTTKANIDRVTKLREYATSKHIGLGSYSLLASRSIDKDNDVVMPNSSVHPMFGNSPCLQSTWGRNYFKKLYTLYEKSGLDLLEHDGSYPGDICASTTHPGHNGLEDSQWKQYVEIRDFYHWCRSKGIYLNVPDWYFLAGSNKIGMGYRETNWSLPRAYQEVIERQNVYDGTWEKTPSMGWMLVPLVEYQGGGEAATIEPLKEHLPHYGQRLANLFGAGVQACYRGPQLYDSPETKAVVIKWVSFYKKHRQVLDADVVHIRRPDGNDYDALLHVNPKGEEKGLLMIYNPLETPITRTLDIDLYYTGLAQQAQMSEQDGAFKPLKLNGTRATIKVTIPAKSQTWVVFK